ncbi:MAG: putative 2-aminoethylphosphonate ABC transporter ATP-binding protein [Spirochaetota bacterium]
MEQHYLEIKNITRSFGNFFALNDVNLGVNEGELICLLGPSGCGKTTLLRVIAGLEEADSGVVILDNRDISALAPIKRNFGIVFQSYALFPNLTVWQNVAYGLQNRGPAQGTVKSRVSEVLELVGLRDSGRKYPSQLSGGQQQRVALARALALSPKMLLLDEPLSALDARVRIRLRRDICDLQKKLGITTVMVTHDQEEALTMADRIAVMNDGVIVQVGTPQEIYERPASPFVADFIGSINFLDGASTPGEYTGEGGELMAIRPEHIHLIHENDRAVDGAINARVKDWEFRGAFYRVTLEIEHGREMNGNDVIIDLPSTIAQNMLLEKHSHIGIRFPRERVLFYNTGSSRVVPA